MIEHHQHAETTSEMRHTSQSTDGALDRVPGLRQRPKCTPAIFIHAGAGFHSHQNEHVHLEACVAAAEMGMNFLRAGATAAEAVEASLRILEDKEITNAGYGSNLSIDGTVECDATVVDHLGRSGACGAAPNIRNPISLAKLILDTSIRPLSLRRVPPNILVGDGAKSFAEEHGMRTFHNEYLVSKNARDRFLRWQEDLSRAESKARDNRPVSGLGLSHLPTQNDANVSQDPHHVFPRDHTAAIMAGTWNEGQPDSPYAATPLHESPSPSGASPQPGYFRSMGSSNAVVGRSQVRATPERSAVAGTWTTNNNNAVSPRPRTRHRGKKTEVSGASNVKATNSSLKSHIKAIDEVHEGHCDGICSSRRASGKGFTSPSPSDNVTYADAARGVKRSLSGNKDGELDRGPKRSLYSRSDGDDYVSDTIGAIAIDNRGQIAGGSSSGGIGMKHRGRLGPAALVGVGTAVVPSAHDDEDGITVAAVTSGTGEHMATTMAAQRCAERIYYSNRRGSGGVNIEDEDEDAIMESFIADDFMGHPGVRNCHSAGAIGVMVVKKTPSGYYFYFAHNTDSFALASMGGSEKEPLCTMSRLPEGAKIAKGGRKVRLD